MDRHILHYEPKVKLIIKDIEGNQSDLFIRGNATLADLLFRLNLPIDQYSLFWNEALIEPNVPLKSLGITHHAVIEVRAKVIYKRRCNACNEIITASTMEGLYTNLGVHTGQTRHRKFSEV